MRHPIIQFCNTSKNGKSQENQISDLVSVAKTQNLECQFFYFMQIRYFQLFFIERENKVAKFSGFVQYNFKQSVNGKVMNNVV